MNDKRGRGLSGATLLVCVALLFAARWFTNQIDQRDKQITYQDFESLVENEQVSDVTIIQNRDVPTGRLEITVVGAQEGDEAKQVYDHRESYRTAAQAIGYKEFFPYFEQTAPLEACTEKLKQASRNYAKRQLTWFRHMDGVVWLDAGAPDAVQTAIRKTSEFLAKG